MCLGANQQFSNVAESKTGQMRVVQLIFHLCVFFLYWKQKHCWNQVYTVIGLVHLAMTRLALQWSLFSSTSDQHLYSLPALGCNFGWMLLQMNAICGEPPLSDCKEETELRIFTGLSCHLRTARVGTGREPAHGVAVSRYWRRAPVLCLISVE